MTSTETTDDTNADTGGSEGGRSSSGGLTDMLKNNPAVSRLGDAAKDYARARGTDAAHKLAGKVGEVTENLHQSGDGGGFAMPAMSGALSRISEGENPLKAAVGGVATGVKEKVKSAFGRSGRSQKFMNIIEDVTVGVPVDVAYNQWTQFQEFASFMKGVDSVDQTDEINSNWKVKVFKSRRTWKATVTEQIPDRKIAWSTDGPKGSTKGVVTFHPLSDDLTQVLLVMEYYPQGLFEKTGNIWRAQGRRARLDLKNFRRFITMRGEETGSWRGEIRDSEVVRGPDEEEESEDRSPTSGGDEEELDERAESDDLEEDEPDEGDEDEDEAEDDEEDEGDEDQYDEDEYEEDEGEDDEGEDDEDAEDYEDEDQYDDEDADQDEPDEEQEAPRGNGRPRRREPAGAGRR